MHAKCVRRVLAGLGNVPRGELDRAVRERRRREAHLHLRRAHPEPLAGRRREAQRAHRSMVRT